MAQVEHSKLLWFSTIPSVSVLQSMSKKGLSHTKIQLFTESFQPHSIFITNWVINYFFTVIIRLVQRGCCGGIKVTIDEEFLVFVLFLTSLFQFSVETVFLVDGSITVCRCICWYNSCFESFYLNVQRHDSWVSKIWFLENQVFAFSNQNPHPFITTLFLATPEEVKAFACVQIYDLFTCI